MAARRAKSGEAIGFLTVVEQDGQGVFGGFLVLNVTGRPLEFHCTTPVKPNRAQEILYGPTLRPYLYGEQIAATLVAKAANKPVVVCTDLPEVLAMRAHVESPVVLVLEDDDGSDSTTDAGPGIVRVDRPHAPAPPLFTFAVGRHQLAVAEEHDADRKPILARLESLGELDLLEPFGRIREAIQEAAAGNR